LTTSNLLILIKKREIKGEVTFIKKDGTKFPGEMSTNVFKDGNGNKRTSMVIRDITKRKYRENVNKKLLENEQLLTEELQMKNFSIREMN
jgi:hypothetical protein